MPVPATAKESGTLRRKVAGVAVGRVIGQRKPARRQKQVRALFADDGGFDARDRAVFFICEQAAVREGERDLGAGRDGCGQQHREEQGVATVALEAKRFSVGGFHLAHIEIRVQLDAHATGNFLSFEFDFGDGGDRLRDGIERGGDVVMIGEKRGRARRLRENRRRSAGEQHQQREQKRERKRRAKFSQAGHRTPFRQQFIQGCIDRVLSTRAVYRIADTSLSVATEWRLPDRLEQGRGWRRRRGRRLRGDRDGCGLPP